MIAILREFFAPTIAAIKSHQVKIFVVLLIGIGSGAGAAYPNNPIVVQIAKAILAVAALIGV